ncbi:hypothetical protein PR002_g8515 [Phytophthora rubi]|uniref:Uncharacterized protein n=1 Tax=Phytophthora rubi TaxID=129364 RepID=A0A6A3N0F5_9STRA|nr:hypothetical protein PR002_g8515 [Phytophthora rubi]
MADDAARSLQQVVPLCDRVRCTDWMELDQALRGSNGLYGRTADFFPALFRSSDRRKKQVSLEKQIQIDKDVTKHMGELKRQFEDGTLIPDEQYNMDESHFVIDLDDGNTLDFVGAQSVKYWSIVSDRFPIQRIKENWCRLAERRNMEAIRNGDWKTGASSSGKLANPGKMFFLKLAAECIRLVNLEKDKDGDNWTKKAMVQCGFDVPRDDWAA